MTQVEMDAFIAKETRRCVTLLTSATALNVEPRRLVDISLAAKGDIVATLGGWRLHTGVYECAASGSDAVRQALYGTYSVSSYFTPLAQELLSASLLAPDAIPLNTLVYSAIHHGAIPVPDKVVRKGQKLLPPIIKFWDAQCDAWIANETYSYRVVDNFKCQLHKLAEKLGQAHAAAKRTDTRQLTLSFAPSSIAKLAAYGIDYQSCYKAGGAHERAKYGLMIHPTAFVALVYDAKANKPETNAPRKGAVLARAWGLMHHSGKAMYINNLYQGSAHTHKDTEIAIVAGVRELLGQQYVQVVKSDAAPIVSALSEYLYINNTPVTLVDGDVGDWRLSLKRMKVVCVAEVIFTKYYAKCNFCSAPTQRRAFNKEGLWLQQYAEHMQCPICARTVCDACMNKTFNGQRICRAHVPTECVVCKTPMLRENRAPLLCGHEHSYCEACMQALTTNCLCGRYKMCLERAVLTPRYHVCGAYACTELYHQLAAAI